MKQINYQQIFDALDQVLGPNAILKDSVSIAAGPRHVTKDLGARHIDISFDMVDTSPIEKNEAIVFHSSQEQMMNSVL